MSDINKARRANAKVFFGGTDITDSIEKYLISLTYTDNEEDQADDLQIQLHDRPGIWLEKWLNKIIDSAAESEDTLEDSKEVKAKYKVIAKSGLNVHSRAGDQYYVYGTLPYGTIIEVVEISGGWVNITYSGKNAYVNASYLEKIYSSVNNAGSKSSSSSSGAWGIGDEVIATGIPQYTSSGSGTPGKPVENYKGTITHLNFKSGIPYPIHVGHLGWFAESQISRTRETEMTVGEGEACKGLRIQAVIARENWKSDGNDDILDCGQFELDSVVAQGPPSTVTIKGTSLPYNSTVRQTKKSKSWENYNLSGIANEMADKNGMTCMFLSGFDPYYERVEQYKSSDIAFLKKLCHDAGCSLKISNQIIILFDQEDYEKKPSIRTIKKGIEGGYSKYKLSTKENDEYTSCRVSYVTSSGTLIDVTEYVDDYDENSDTNQCLEVCQKVANISEAKELARKMLRLHNKYSFSCTFTFPGDTALVAGCTVVLEDFGPWSGKYVIKQAKHSIKGSGYSTEINLRKALASDSDAAQQNSDNLHNESSDLDEIAWQVIRGDWGNGSERRRRLTEAGKDPSAVRARVNELLGI